MYLKVSWQRRLGDVVYWHQPHRTQSRTKKGENRSGRANRDQQQHIVLKKLLSQGPADQYRGDFNGV